LNVVEYFCLGFTLFAVTDTLRKHERKGHSLIGFQKVLAAHSFTWIGIQTMFVYMYAYVKDTLPGLNDEAMGKVVSIAFLIFNAVAAILPALVLEPLTRKYGRVKTHLACIASMAFGYGAFLVAGKSETGIYALMALLGIGWAATVSLPFAIMSQKVDQSKMGQYMGMFNLSVVLPQLVCSLGIGILVSQAAGKEIIFYISAITLAVSAVCWYFVQEGS
jgi:MFS family permease